MPNQIPDARDLDELLSQARKTQDALTAARYAEARDCNSDLIRRLQALRGGMA